MTLPLLKLPYLTIHVFLSMLQLDEIIDFSLCSQQLKRLVQSMRRRPFLAINIHASKVYPCLTLRTESNEFGLTWCFNSIFFKKNKTLKKRDELLKREVRRIGGMNIFIAKEERNTTNSPKTEEFQMKLIYEYLQEIFKNPPCYTFYVNSDGGDCPMLPIYMGIEECSDMCVSGRHISDDQLKYILENVRVSERLTLFAPISPNFRLDTARISVEELTIHNSHWMSRDTFLSLDCQRIFLSNWPLRMEDFEDFVQRWLDSDDTRLICMRIYTGQWERIDYNKFQTQPWDPTVRGEFFRTRTDISSDSKMRCRDGRDLIRRDSLMATIGLLNRGMYFVVWHQRFPNLDDLLGR